MGKIAFHSSNEYKQDIVIFGGYCGKVYQNAVQIYYTKKNKWEKTIYSGDTSAPSPRISHSSAIYGDWLYIYGGSNFNGQFFNDIWKYNLKSKVWEQLSNSEDIPKVIVLFREDQDIQ